MLGHVLGLEGWRCYGVKTREAAERPACPGQPRDKERSVRKVSSAEGGLESLLRKNGGRGDSSRLHHDGRGDRGGSLKGDEGCSGKEARWGTSREWRARGALLFIPCVGKELLVLNKNPHQAK